MARGDDSVDAGPLAGQTVYVVGRMHGLARIRLERLVAQAGGRLVRRLSAKTSLVVLAHSATAGIENDGAVALSAEHPYRATLISENELRRRLSILPSLQPQEQGLTGKDLARVASLPEPVLRCLALFDVIEPLGGFFAYRDLLAARETKRLLDAGARLKSIIEADLELRRRGQRLTDVRLTVTSSGQLLHAVGGTMAELSGQLTMPFCGETIDVDEAFRAAESAEQDGDLAKAESLYALLMRIEQSDPVLPFNLGNVLREQGRSAEAKVAWQMAVARDPGFAEAWYNLALASEDEGQKDLAAAQYRRAIEARPDFDDARFNLALLLTRSDRFAEARPMWEALLASSLTPDQLRTAKRAAKLCDMHLAAERSKTG